MRELYYYKCHLLGRLSKNGARRPAIIDGDTIDVLVDLGFSVKKECRLRLMGINTPESRTRNLEEKSLGLAAKKFLAETLAESDSIEFLSHGTGKYGRVLADVYAVTKGTKAHINALMVKQGHAREYHGGKREPWTRVGS